MHVNASAAPIGNGLYTLELAIRHAADLGHNRRLGVFRRERAEHVACLVSYYIRELRSRRDIEHQDVFDACRWAARIPTYVGTPTVPVYY